MNTSGYSLVSFGTRLLAYDTKAIARPSKEMAGVSDSLLAWILSDDTETRLVSPVCRSCTKIFAQLTGGAALHRTSAVVSCGAKLLADEAKLTKRPSAEIAG